MTSPLHLAPIHPGAVLREEFLGPMGLSPGAVARAIGVPRTRIERLAKEQVDLSPDTALRLARLFGTSADFWMNIQMRYALESTADELGNELAAIHPLQAAE
jgi:antitoxin HigA-1